MMQLSYDDAVKHIQANQSSVYTFIPIIKGQTTVGGSIYILHYEDDPEEFPDHYWITYAGGHFHSSSGEEESFSPEEVPQKALDALYTPVPSQFSMSFIDYELQIVLKTLQGTPIEEALNHEEA